MAQNFQGSERLEAAKLAIPEPRLPETAELSRSAAITWGLDEGGISFHIRSCGCGETLACS